MFHKIKSINILPDYYLTVHFSEGVTKGYDMKVLLERTPAFKRLQKHPELFEEARVDVGGYGVVWDDETDISCDELFANGEEIKTPFDGLIAFSDATEIWGLNESTLRKAIAYGKLINGVDVCKYGKQWVISSEAMRREYGEPKR